MNLKRRTKMERVINGRQEGVVVLEDVHDPHNAAAVMRSCDAFGIQKVYFVFEQEEKYDPNLVGKVSSSSANKWLSFKIFESSKECAAELKKEGFELVATVLDKEAETIYDCDLSKRKIALIFGNEHRGISEGLLRVADKKMYIPMRGMVQSLNISVTAGISLFEMNRQRRETGGDIYGLELEEKRRLLREFGERR